MIKKAQIQIIQVCDFMIYWALVVIPFSIAIAPGMTYSFMGFLYFGFVIKKIIKPQRPFIHTPLNFPYLLLMIAAVLSFKNTVDIHSSFHGIGKLIQNAFLFLICAEEVKDRKHLTRIIVACMCGASLAAVDALWQIQFGRDFIRGRLPIINIGIKRATAAFPNANVFGVYVSALAPLIIGVTVFYYKGTERVRLFVPALLAVIGTILSYSRGTFVGLYAGILFLSVCRKKRMLTISLLAFLIAVPFLMPKNVKQWARDLNYNPVVFMLNSDRINIYRNALNMIRHHPFIGVGINTFSQNYLKYKLPEKEGITGDHMYAHNNFLQMAGEIGLFGAAAFLFLLYRFARFVQQGYKEYKDEYYRIVLLSLAACIITFLINGLTETNLYYARVAMIFWYLLGLGMSLKKIAHASTPRTD